MYKALLSRWYALEGSSPAVRVAAIALMLVAYAAALLGARLFPQHDIIVLPLVLFGAFRLATSFARPEDAARRFAIVLGVALVVLVINVAWLWRVGYHGRHHVFGGVIALSDAHGYYEDAERVLHGLPMHDGGVRRPLSVAVMGGLLRLTGGHVRVMMLVLVLGWAAAVAMVTTTITRTHGTVAGSVVGVVLLLFARRYAGLFQPENVATPIGAVGFCLLWRAAHLAATSPSEGEEGDGWVGSLAGGLVLVTIALLARPGPLSLPLAIAAWALVVARRRGRPARRRVLATVALAVALGASVQVFVQKTTSPSASYGDYPAIFYGMLHGEEHTYLMKAHPWLAEVPEGARSAATFALVRRELAERPLLLPLGLVRCFASHVALPQGLFGFVWNNPDDRVLEDKAVVDRAMRDHGVAGPLVHWVQELGVYSVVNALVMALLGLAFVVMLVWAAVRARKRTTEDPHLTLLLFFLAGVAASWPMLPPWITEGAQMHASVFVGVVALPAVVFFGRRDEAGPAPAPSRARLAIAIPCALVTLVGIALVFPAPVPRGAACDDPRTFVVSADRQARVTFGARSDATIALADAKQNIALLAKRNRAISEELAQAVARPSEIVPGFDACRGRLYYFVDDRDLFAAAAPWAPFRGELLSPEKPLVVGDSGDAR